mgnify:CR=1 FL=1
MKTIKYSDIVVRLNQNLIEVKSDIKDDEEFSGINSLLNAQKEDISFFSNIKYVDNLKICKAKACLINSNYIKYLPDNCKSIIVKDPYLAFACLTELFNILTIKSNGIISEYVNLNKKCKIHENVQIDSFTNIGPNTEIFNDVIIGSNVNIGPDVVINNNSIIHNNVTISNCIIEEGCEIKPGARIGSAGFGFEEKSKKKIIHIGNVIISKGSTIGSNTTIDRAVFDSTKIGAFSQIDNLVQIAHNVEIGNHAIIAAQVGIAGSTKIGNNIKIGGQSGLAGHLNIGNNVTIAGKSGVTKNIEDNKVVAGFPAKDINEWKRDIIKIGKLNDIRSK